MLVRRTLLALLAAIALSVGTAVPANAIVLPVTTVNSVTWTFNDGYTNYTCTSRISMTVNATTVVGTSKVTCDKTFLLLTIDAVFTSGTSDVKLCTNARSCTLSLTKTNAAGVQRHCFGMSTVAMNGTMWVPNSARAPICFSN